MPPWLTNSDIWKHMLFMLLPIAAISSVAWIAVAFVATHRRPSGQDLLILFCFSSLGITAGVLAASSDSSVLASLLPAVLSLVGGIATYLVSGPESTAGSDAPKRAALDRCTVGASVTVLSLALLLGALIGADIRRRADAYLESFDYKKQRVDVDRQLEQYQHVLAVTDSIPAFDLEGKLKEVNAALSAKTGAGAK